MTTGKWVTEPINSKFVTYILNEWFLFVFARVAPIHYSYVDNYRAMISVDTTLINHVGSSLSRDYPLLSPVIISVHFHEEY